MFERAHCGEGGMPSIDGLAGAEAQPQQERLQAQEGAGQGKPPRRSEVCWEASILRLKRERKNVV